MPFRIAARHPDRDHYDHAWHQVGGLYDSAEDAQADIDAEAPEPVGRSAEDRIVRKADALTSERADAGYELQVEELVPKTTGTDDGGSEIVTEHEWKAVG